MSNPWALYDNLIDAIDASAKVSDYQVGNIWTRVTADDGTSGVAMTTDVRTRPSISTESLIGRPLREAAMLVRSWNLAEAGIGVAAINAWHNHPGRIPSCGYRFPENTEGTEGAFDTYAELVQGKKVATIGHFRFIENRFEGVGELCIIERRPRDNDYPDTASEYILPDQDFVFITGSTLVNKTLPRLLELSQDAYVVLTGPSSTMSPILYDYGVNGLSGLVCTNPEHLTEILRGTGRGFPSAAGTMVDFAKVKPEL